MIKSLWTRYTADKDMYDEGGYCDYEIKRGEDYYWRQVGEEGGERMCCSCAMRQVLHENPELVCE